MGFDGHVPEPPQEVVVRTTAPSNMKMEVFGVPGMPFKHRHIFKVDARRAREPDEVRPNQRPIRRLEVIRASFAGSERREVVWSELKNRATDITFRSTLRPFD